MNCRVSLCDREGRARRMCKKHYLQWHRRNWKKIKAKRLPPQFSSIKRQYKHGISTATAKGMTSRDYVRELVRTRDNWTCQTCQKKWSQGQRRFDVHHLRDMCGKMSGGVDRIVDIPNLITLCHKCHYNHPTHTLKVRKLSPQQRSEL